MDNNFQDETLLARWLTGALTPEELEALQQREDYAGFVQIIEGMEGLRLPEYRETEAWQQLQQKLATEKKNPAPKSSIVNPKSKIIPLRRIASIAAALAVIALGIWWFAGKNGGAPNVDTSIATTTGEQQELKLPDGSQVTLNALSTLEYSAAGWDGERRVELSGEAFFKAKKGRRFTVQTKQGKVEVVGTQFNVYVRDRELEVKCTEGKVQVTNPAGTERILLSAGEQVAVVEGRMQRRQGLASYPNWFKGESSFRSAPLERVFGEMERQYGVVVVADSVAGRTFSGKFVHQDLEKALRMVCGPMGLEWTVAGDTVQVGK
jgi:transmembrane sensor